MNPAPALKTRPFILAWFIFLLVMEFCGAGFVGSGAAAKFDFRSFYTAGYQLRTHPSQLYNLAAQQHVQDALVSKARVLPFFHPGYEVLLYLPFSILHYRSAYLAFIAFNALLLIPVFLMMSRQFCSIFSPWQLPPGSSIFLFVPLLVAIVQGQDSVLSLLLYCLAWQGLQSGSDSRAGCFLALALFKFQLVIPIAALVAFRRGRRFLTGFVITAAIVAMLSIALVGRTGVMDLTKLFLSSASAVNQGTVLQNGMSFNPSGMPNLAGLLSGCGVRFLLSPVAFNVLVDICALGVFIWCARAVRNCELKSVFPIAILCGLLVSYHLFIYDLALALVPVALLRERIHRFTLYILYILPIVLFAFGSKWLFLFAIPVIAILIQVTRSAGKKKSNPSVISLPT